jgi:hypothetical protein
MNMIQVEKCFSPRRLLVRFPAAGLALVLFGLSAAGEEPETFARKDIKLLGSIDYGQTSAPSRLSERPPYSGYAFNAKPGDKIEITVTGTGELRAYLTTSDFKKLAGGSVHFVYTFDPDSAPGTYYVLVTEAHHKAANFTVDLERPSTVPSATPDYLSCSADSDCVAVDRAGCCHNGYKDAVNASQQEAYRAANACTTEHHMCPMFMIVDKRVARCNTTLKRCEMVERGRHAPNHGTRNAVQDGVQRDTTPR